METKSGLSEKFIGKLTSWFDNDVNLSIINVIGSPGTGKTTLIETIIGDLVRAHGRENINYVYSRNIRDCYERVDPEKSLQVYFVEDAGREQASRDSMTKEGRELFRNLPDVRHHIKENGLDEGRAIIILSSHDPTHIDKLIRGFEDLRIYKDMNLSEDAYRRVLEKIDVKRRHIKKIQKWIDAVGLDNTDAMSSYLMISRSGKYTMKNFKPDGKDVEPDIHLVDYSLDSDDSNGDNGNTDDAAPTVDLEEGNLSELIDYHLKDMKMEDAWEKKARVLEKSLEGHSHSQISEKLDVAIGSVSAWKSEAMGELKNRVGHDYETIVTEELEKKDWCKRAENLGKTGDPDIIAYIRESCEDERFEGLKTVSVSVKLFEHARNRHSIKKNEFRPEIEYAKNNNTDAYAWYTNLKWGGENGQTYFFRIHEHLDRVELVENDGLVSD